MKCGTSTPLVSIRNSVSQCWTKSLRLEPYSITVVIISWKTIDLFLFFYFEILSKQYDGSPPFYMLVESPSSVRRGETLGIRLMAINNLKEEAIALIVLEASDDYLFVETDDDGEVEHYRPNLVGGERQHMVAVRTQSARLNLPI
jgi:hypothetical protein